MIYYLASQQEGRSKVAFFKVRNENTLIYTLPPVARLHRPTCCPSSLSSTRNEVKNKGRKSSGSPNSLEYIIQRGGSRRFSLPANNCLVR